MIDWDSSESSTFLNPRMPAAEREHLETLIQNAPRLAAHVWLATSGSTGGVKMVALPKAAMLASADAVNRHIGATSSRSWLRVLPIFHVGGLAIHARAALCGSRVEVDEWDPRRFTERCLSDRIAFSALVPAQVFDLIAANLKAPATLQAIIVGGGSLSEDHYNAAQALGWPLLPSYGMTECCSQVATATNESADLRLLSHLRGRVEPSGTLAFTGPSLLTGYATQEGFIDPKENGWFISEDLGAIEGDVVRVSGRARDFIKIGGESVDLSRLDHILADVVRETGGDAALVAVADDRLGYVIHAATTADGAVIAERFNARVLPFERIRATHQVARIPRTSLGKLERAALLTLVRE